MKRALILLITAVLLAAAALGMTGCAAIRSTVYDNAEQYTVGDAEISAAVERIEIDWPSGRVDVTTHAGDALLLTERTDAGVPDEFRVHWWLDGATLHVKFAASGARMELYGGWRKELTLTLPETLALDDVEIRSASTEISAEGLSAENLAVSTASGDVCISCDANAIRLGSASGSIRLTQQGNAGEVSINTASGKIDASLSRANTAELESASGSITLAASSVDDLTARGTSGAVTCDLAVTPARCRLHAVSGEVTLTLPEDAAFTARVTTTSGSIQSDFALKKEGNTYVSGSGDADVAIDTTSGSISIRQGFR
ncbi:MAG: DUF4097 family beta strand repeat-containing protein [Candidatus Spyradocola sp.]